MHFNPRLFDVVDEGGIRVAGWIVDLLDGSIVKDKAIDDAGSCCDDIEVEFTSEALEDDFKV